jgi:glycosyltransferase involved in cell wall biosynthesis
VSTFRRRKSAPVVLQALMRVPDLNLVWAGDLREDVASVAPLIAGDALAGRVRFIGYVDRSLLPGLHGSAALLIAPSPNEGFGLPVLEAMASGTPVVAARCGGLPEAGGDAAAYFEPEDARSLASAIERILLDPRHRDDLVGRGLRRASEMTWHRSASMHAAVWSKVADARKT